MPKKAKQNKNAKENKLESDNKDNTYVLYCSVWHLNHVNKSFLGAIICKDDEVIWRDYKILKLDETPNILDYVIMTMGIAAAGNLNITNLIVKHDNECIVNYMSNVTPPETEKMKHFYDVAKDFEKYVDKVTYCCIKENENNYKEKIIEGFIDILDS